MNGFSPPWARAARVPVLMAISLMVVIAGLVGGCQGTSGPLAGLGADVAAETGDEAALVRVAACWSALPLVSELTSEYGRQNPRTAFDVVSVQADVARDLVATGQADVAVVDADPAAATGDSAGLVARSLAVDAVAVVAHPSLGMGELSAGQVAALYAGEYLRWDELGGPAEAVEVLVQAPGAIERAVFERALMGNKVVSSFAVVVPHDRAVIEYVAEHPGAIGYVSNAYVDERVCVVAVDGHRPTATELRSGRYPLGYPLMLLTTPDGAREAERWAAYSLGNRGRQVVERRYAVPR
jgi:phosphate transport system substrate-binding protein